MHATRSRSGWLAELFPDGIPALWCPVISHYAVDGGFDRARVAAHLQRLAPHVKGLLIPGSTGDGWEMTDAEVRALLEIVVPEVARLKMHLLIGVLKTETPQALAMIQETVAWLQKRTGQGNALAALKAARVCGFTVCPPKGADLSQAQIAAQLTPVLETGLPVALYQLPQVTLNEMAPETVAALAAEFPNFILFKDTSGADRVVLSGADLQGVFLVRGAEGDYVRWLKSRGGQYDGFLLSTANCFAQELAKVIQLAQTGKVAEAEALSKRLSAVVKDVFEYVAGVPQGNAFANANKAMDHFFAYGPVAEEVPPPRLHAGADLPVNVIRRTGQALERHGLRPKSGYLASLKR